MTWLEIVRNSYQIAVGAWGIQPESFWRMSPEEWWWLHECKRPKDREHDYAGTLTDDVVAELYESIH